MQRQGEHTASINRMTLCIMISESPVIILLDVVAAGAVCIEDVSAAADAAVGRSACQTVGTASLRQYRAKAYTQIVSPICVYRMGASLHVLVHATKLLL